MPLLLYETFLTANSSILRNTAHIIYDMFTHESEGAHCL